MKEPRTQPVTENGLAPLPLRLDQLDQLPVNNDESCSRSSQRTDTSGITVQEAVKMALNSKLGREVSLREVQLLFSEQRLRAVNGQILQGDEAAAHHSTVHFYRPVHDEQLAENLPKLEILWENPVAAVVFKPHNLATMPRGVFVARSVIYQARKQWNNPQVIAAHRLDRLTDGCLLLVKDPRWRGAYQQLFDRQQVSKRYQAWTRMDQRAAALDTVTRPLLNPGAGADAQTHVIRNRGDNEKGNTVLITEPIGRDHTDHWYQWQANLEKKRGHMAVTVHGFEQQCYRLQRGHRELLPTVEPGLGGSQLQGFDGGLGQEKIAKPNPRKLPGKSTLTWGRIIKTQVSHGSDSGPVHCQWDLRPKTGYLHQLRAVLAAAGHPIIGDPLYPKVNPDWLRAPEHRMWLRSIQLAFTDPYSEQRVTVNAPDLPAEAPGN